MRELKYVSYVDARKLMVSKAIKVAGSAHNADQYLMVHDTVYLDSSTVECIHLMGISCFRAIPGRTPVLCLAIDEANHVSYEWHPFMRCTRVER